MVQEEIQFKYISYLELWQPFCTAEQNHLCNFSRGYFEEQLGNYFELGGGVIFFKISYLELWWPACSVERDHLDNFSGGHYGEHFCETIF